MRVMIKLDMEKGESDVEDKCEDEDADDLNYYGYRSGIGGGEIGIIYSENIKLINSSYHFDNLIYEFTFHPATSLPFTFIDEVDNIHLGYFYNTLSSTSVYTIVYTIHTVIHQPTYMLKYHIPYNSI